MSYVVLSALLLLAPTWVQAAKAARDGNCSDVATCSYDFAQVPILLFIGVLVRRFLYSPVSAPNPGQVEGSDTPRHNMPELQSESPNKSQP